MMARLPREVREERLQRFLRQREDLHEQIQRMEGLLRRIAEAEVDETDRLKLSEFARTKIELKRQVSEAQATILRTTKSIQHEQELLTRYDEESVDPQSEPQKTDQDAAEGLIESPPPELLDALKRVQQQEIGDLTLRQVELIQQWHERLSSPANVPESVRPLAKVLEDAVALLDDRLASLRKAFKRRNPQ